VAVLTATAPEVAPAYVALARRTADRALAAGRLSPAEADALLDALSLDAPAPPGEGSPS
jgi:hypothetical protein